jgi:hypothetical protein
VPALLMVVCVAMLMTAPLGLVAAFMLGFVFYSTWHFGRQNGGIAAFAARVGNARPLEREERAMLNTGVVAGPLVSYRAFAPTLMLSPELWPFDLSHGLQYLVMLAFHAGGAVQGEQGERMLRPAVTFGVSLPTGVGLWLAADRRAGVTDETMAKALFAVIMALTLAHYRIDAFLWRFRTPARRAWLVRSYPFLGGSAGPAPRPVLVGAR